MTIFVSKSPNSIKACDKHSHNCWEIVIPTSGQGALESKDYNFSFAVNCVYIIPPNVMHSSYSDSGFTDIYIHTDFLKLKRNKITVLYGLEEMPALANIIYDAYSKKEQGHSGSVDCTLNLISQIIYEHLDEDPNNLLINARNFLIDNIADSSLSMKTLSNNFGYNGDYIRRVFKTEFGITPMEYLNNLRLSKAKDLLQNMPMYKIEQISELCGFSDPFYFSRFFKKRTGLSPKNFKKNST